MATGAVPFTEAVGVWWRIGCLSFGGPAGQIALMHRMLVAERGWIDEARFLHALNFCMLLPGPEAQQLATYIGWLLHGVRGALVAGVLFIVPGAVAILLLAWLYVSFGEAPALAGLLLGLKAAVLAIVVQAMLRIGARTLRGPVPVLVAVAAFLALFVFSLPFPLVVLAAGVLGALLPGHFAQRTAQASEEAGAPLPVPPQRGTHIAAGTCALLWGATLVLVPALAGEDSVFTALALFFSKMAVVTFGGAYAVLAYVAQQGVEHYGWLAPGEMLDGLGLAETTPGPLILVTEFVGFLAAHRAPGGWPPLLAACAGALLTLWVTFLPCFLWIFAGAPHVEALRARRKLSAALSAITAAVVGVIANLALWFAISALFARSVVVDVAGVVQIDLPVAASLQPVALVLTLVAVLLMFVLRWRMLAVLGTTALLGVCWQLLA